MDFIVPLLEDLGINFVEIGASSKRKSNFLSEAEIHSYQHAADQIKIGKQMTSKVVVMENVHALRDSFAH